MPRVASILASLLAAIPISILQAGFNPETGLPVFQHFSPDQYNGASPQNWAVAQDRRGIMYFGNTDGVLEFDGHSWRLIRLKNGSTVRSLAVDAQGKVYVGGQGDFGFLEPDTTGTLQFVSLLTKVPASDRKFGDVWRIFPTPAGVYFSAYSRLFRLNGSGAIQAWRPETNFGRAIYVLNALYVKTREQGLLKMTGDNLSPVADGAMFASLSVSDGMSLDETALVATYGRIFQLDAAGTARPFPTEADAWFEANTLNSIYPLPNGEIAAAARKGGIVILRRDGAVDRFISKSSGLPDDVVSAMFSDNQGGVWLAQNNGITRFNPGLSRYDGGLGLEGDVQCMTRFNGTMYVGSTAGLFAMDPAPGVAPRFRRIAGIGSRVYALQPSRDELLAATGEGVFRYSGQPGKFAVLIFESRPSGVWDVSTSPSDPDTIYVAGMAGVFMLRRSGETWSKAAEFPGGSFRTVLQDVDGKVWATTREAIWRLDFREHPVISRQFTSDQGVPGGWITARRLQGHVVFATSKGLRRYSASLKRFAPDLSLGTQFADGSRDVFNVFEDPQGNVWVTGEGYHGVLTRQAEGYRWRSMPLLGAGIQEIYWASLDGGGTTWAVGAKYVLHRWESGLAGDPDRDFRVRTRLIQVRGEKDNLYGGGGDFASRRLPWKDNALEFAFAAPFYEDPGAVEYQTMLEGSDKDWSPASHDTASPYNYLPEGRYRFRVRARTPHGAVAEDAAVAFTVLPPWYRTWWAYSFYLVCGGLGVWGVVRLRTRQLEEDKRRLEVVIEERTVEIREQRDQIQIEERKSHSLLLNVLPAAVADELKTTGSVQPVGFDDVTVCFTDFVGFTLSSEKMQPGKLVNALNEYFTRFDEIVARYGLEKLKTIGDSYMFVSGLPAPRASHAVDAVLAALEMVEVVKELGRKTDGTGWNIRVGLHSGPVVAGVVGIRKFAFDIWGNTVNFAARMESSGVPGRVNMSERTCRLTRELIDCEARGQIRIKEGRELPMFLARRAAVDFAARYEDEFGEKSCALLSENVETEPVQAMGAR